MISSLSIRCSRKWLAWSRSDLSQRGQHCGSERTNHQTARHGALRKLVTGRVLNEGVDVPDANVAIIASGSASMREYVQRLGRVLRPKPGEALLYELISRRTTERNAARRRRPTRRKE